MKNIIALLITVITTMAADTPKPSNYTANEVSLDGFATGRMDALTRITYGGGIGVNWFPYRTAGIGIEAATEDCRHSFFDNGSAKLIGRLPWNQFALNFGLGSGFDFERDRWSVFAEVGPEFRLRKDLSVFGSIRGVRPISDASREHVLAIVGLRLTL